MKEPHEHPVVVNYFGAQEAPLIRKLANAGMDNTLTGDPDLCLGFPALHSVPLAS